VHTIGGSRIGYVMRRITTNFISVEAADGHPTWQFVDRKFEDDLVLPADFKPDPNSNNERATRTETTDTLTVVREIKIPVYDKVKGALLYDICKEENGRKNNTRQWILDNFTELTQLVTDQSGNSSIQFKEGIDFAFRFEGLNENRVMYASVKGVNLTPQKKNLFQQAMDLLFGTGKVVVE
jgi:hypothetical protein